MMSWLSGQSKAPMKVIHGDTEHESLLATMASVYEKKLKPLEVHTKFEEFYSPLLDEGHFNSKPMVMLMGQYSTGKTTFLSYILEKNLDPFGDRIGPEPTTDTFCILDYNHNEDDIPGNALVHDMQKPYKDLVHFGGSFLNRLKGINLDSEPLKNLILVDTPGILSGDKQSKDRGYDFNKVVEWFAHRVDRIILLFDAHKIDISNELKDSIFALRGNEEKMRIVLNKADQMDSQLLMRVHGALLWSLAKVIPSPEVIRVYTGSFWSKPLQMEDNRKLFEMEKTDLFNDLQKLPRQYPVRLLNDIIKRARLALVHAYILQAVKYEISSLRDNQKDIIDKLPQLYAQIKKAHKNQISDGDFPEVEHMQKCLNKLTWNNLKELPKFNQPLVDMVVSLLEKDIPPLMARLNRENEEMVTEVHGGVFETEASPFSEDFDKGVNRGQGEEGWIVDEEKDHWLAEWEKCKAQNNLNSQGKIPGRIISKYFQKTKLPSKELTKLWVLSDVDKDGALDYEEFALMSYLIKYVALDNQPIPAKLPEHLIPPGKKELVAEREASGGSVERGRSAGTPLDRSLSAGRDKSAGRDGSAGRYRSPGRD